MTGAIMGEFVRGTHHIIREVPVDEDARGPDSLECDGVTSDVNLMHRDCWFDYSKLPFGLGFLCGCVCHDDPEAPALVNDMAAPV